jgi:2,2-dialkylglycine decarboxylase (pyruvate)
MEKKKHDAGGTKPAGTESELWPAVERHLIRYGGDFLPVVISRAHGSYLYDEGGRAILDFTSGQMCAILGHDHPAVRAAVEKALGEVVHLYSNMLSPAVIRLGEALAGLLPPALQKAMFLSTGAESNEAALRMAKLSTGRFEVVAFSASWHGMTAGASSNTYARGRRGYGPPVPGSLVLPTPNPYRCPIGHCRERCDTACLDAGFQLVDAQSVGELAAVIAEPILSSGGIIELTPEYLNKLKALCEARGMLLILDEAQTALGRVGRNFAFEHSGVVPDVLTLSKTLGAGLPLAATVTSREIEEACHGSGFLYYTSHVSDPLPAEVGLAVLNVIASEELGARAIEMGTYLKRGLLELKKRHEAVGDVRGAGLLLGLELVRERETREPHPDLGSAVARRALELGLSLSPTSSGGVFRIAPPLTISRDEIDSGLAMLDQALAECAGAGN